MFKFRKVASVLASSVMLTSTVALAAAANYPAPFVMNGAADAALVWGTSAAATDVAAVVDITNNLNSFVVSQGGTTGGSTTVVGEAAPLFTGGTKIYVNDSLNAVTSTITKSELPTVLAKETFSGNVEATYEQTIDLGTNPQVTFNKQPTSSDQPQYALTTSTSSANYIYNATVTFSKAVNLSHADSKGEDIMLFGQKFTIASATDGNNLVLLKTAEKISLTSDDPSAEVTVGGKTYTVELVSASDTTATIKVTDSSGNSETKEVNENASKKIQGVTIAVTNADETNLKLSASVIAGAEKVTISATAGANVKYGEEDKTIDGTATTITATSSGGMTALTKIVFSIYAADSDKDAILPGDSFVDPVFGTIKLDFPSLNIASDSTTQREEISVNPSGDDKMTLSFMPHYSGEEETVTWVKNLSTGMNLQYDDDAHNITVAEMEQTYRSGYLVLGNEDEGRLVKASTISNDSSTSSGDTITLSDVYTGDPYTVTVSAEGTGTVVIGGKSYTVTYGGTSSSDANWVRLNHADSSGQTAVLYPTIESSEGAKVAFYEPVTINLVNWDGASNTLTGIKLPDGDGYTDVTIGAVGVINGSSFNVTCGGSTTAVGSTVGSVASFKSCTVGPLTYYITASAANTTRVLLTSPDSTSTNLTDPALILFEEKDDNSDYQAMVVTLEPGSTGDDGMGVDDVKRTWAADGINDQISIPGSSSVTKEADLWGTIITRDGSDSDQVKATINYPDEQIYAMIYMAEVSASITSGGGSSGGGTTNIIGITDAEASSYPGKNLIVVGGSCINTVAASLLGSSTPMCGADFTAATTVGANQWLIQTFTRSGGAVATLVAGYNALDTTNAATYLTTQTVGTDVDTKYVGTSSTQATLVTSGTSA